MTTGVGVSNRTLRVPCTACGDGYLIPWRARDGALFYKCLLCETPLDFPTHRARKAEIVAALEAGRDVACFIVDEAVLQGRTSFAKCRRRKRAPRTVSLNA